MTDPKLPAELTALIQNQLYSYAAEEYAGLHLAATEIAAGLSEAIAAGDQESAEELIEQFELLGEVQRLGLTNQATSALREILTFAVRFAFSFIPAPPAQ